MTNHAGNCRIPKVRRILLATDGTEISQGATREAISLARQCSAVLHAVSVIEAPSDHEGFKVQQLEEMPGTEIRNKLEVLKAEAAKEWVTCETIVVTGDPAAAIVDVAGSRRADLIVIGRRELKGFADSFMGAVGTKVIRIAPCDVLVVPPDARIECRIILVATDGSAHAEKAAEKSVLLAKQCGGKLIALSAARNVDEIFDANVSINRVGSIGLREGIAVEPLIPPGSPSNAIVDTADKRHVGLIVMGIYGKSGPKEISVGGTTEKVVGRAGCAVLVVKAQVYS